MICLDKGEVRDMCNNFRKIAILSGLLILPFILSFFSFAKDEDKKMVTQGELARILVDRMGLDVPKEVPATKCFSTLEQKGIKPIEGWNQDKPVTTRDLEKILVETGRLQSEVLSGKDPKSILQERGIILPSAIDKKAMDNILKDQGVNRLFETPAISISGPSIPFPKEGVKVIEKPPEFVSEPIEVVPPEPTEPPKAEPPPPIEPPAVEPPRPSGGGGQ